MVQEPNTRTAAIYVRISRDSALHSSSPDVREEAEAKDERLGVKRQRADCEALVERQGYRLLDVYEDNDISAFNGRRRPDYERLLDDVRAGLVDVVVAWHPDRLTRKPKELETLLTVVESTGTTIQTVQAGALDLGTATGRAVARTITVWANFESEHKRDRIRRAFEELAKAGKVSGGGIRPFGYEKGGITIRPDEAALIQDAALRVLGGDGPTGIARDWNARGVPTPTGKEWRTATVRNMLCRPRLAGLRSHRGEVVAEAEWSAIIDLPTHERLRSILLAPGRGTRPVGRTYLLTGLLVCSRCGAPMMGHRRTDRRGGFVPSYVCLQNPGQPGCGKTRVVAGPLDDFVAAAALEALAGPALAAALEAEAASDETGVGSALANAQARLTELAAEFGHGGISRAEWFAMREAAEGQIADLRRRLATDSRRRILIDVAGLDAATLRERWDATTIDQRRALLGAVFDRIEVGPGVRGRNRFDSDRVRFVWRA